MAMNILQRMISKSDKSVENTWKKSGPVCVGHGHGFYVNTSGLAANIFFGIWEWNESNEMDTWLLL